MYILFFIFGALFGSFINALVYRLHQGLNFVNARSMCPKCKHTLSWYELVPVFSFVWQKGKCRHCRKTISWQYPLVEVLTGGLFVLVFLSQLPTGVLLAPSLQEIVKLVGLLIFTIFLIIIFLYDFKYYLILDKITLPAMALAFVWQLVLNFSWQHMLTVLVAASVGGGFFLLQYVVSKGKWIGGGDIRLGFLMGLILAWPGILVALMLAYIIGAVFAIGMLLLKKKRWGSQIPFGTFLSLGTFIALLYSQELINWYISLL
jgi:prepilin signal peptidase PulO-like enzyme (type II secretory pathway)